MVEVQGASLVPLTGCRGLCHHSDLMKTLAGFVVVVVILLGVFFGSVCRQVCVAAYPEPSPSSTPDLEKTKQLVERSTVIVVCSEADRASGATGFVVDKNGKKYIVTNIHVLAGQAFSEADELWTEGAMPPQGLMRDPRTARIKSSFPQYLRFAAGTKLPVFKARDGSVITPKSELLMSASRDIALIEVQTDVPALKIQEPSLVSAGQDFLALGNPEAEHTLIKLDGRLDGVGPERLELNIFREKLKPGMSGSPVVNPTTGEVIGILAYKVERKEKKDDEVHDSFYGPRIVRVYETVTRNFAFRMDNLTDLQAMNWQAFAVQCAMIRALHERTYAVTIAGLCPLKDWSGGVFDRKKLEALEIPGDSDSSVSMAFNSLVRDLERLQGTDEIWKRWERFQRELENLLTRDLVSPQMAISVPYLRRIVSEDIAADRSALAGRLRKESGKINTSSGR